jgi:AhpD family alkylhydroperoxidase
MNKKTEELIALGASVSAHCLPCIDYHLEQAKKLGVSDKEIHDAVRVGLEVMNGAGGKIKEKIKTELPGIKIKGNESCVETQGKNKIKIIPFIPF